MPPILNEYPVGVYPDYTANIYPMGVFVNNFSNILPQITANQRKKRSDLEKFNLFPDFLKSLDFAANYGMMNSKD